MTGMPLSIDGKTSATAESGSEQAGLEQNPIITTIVGDGTDVTGILSSLSQLAATTGNINNQLASQAVQQAAPISEILGTLNPTPTSTATSIGGINSSTLLLIGGGILILLLIIKHRKGVPK
jgi:hypothetical protein